MSKLLQILARLVALLCAASPVLAAEREAVELIPADRSSWSATNFFAPVTGLFLGGPGYWYSPRKIEIDTTPPGAILDLFYVRANFQKRFEQAESPILLLLPSRIEAGPRDSVTIRALLDGYRQEEVHVKVRSRETRVLLELEPLPNLLEAMTHAYFSGRGSLRFLTQEALTFRIQKASDGFSIVLLETGQTGNAAATMEGVTSPNIESLRGQQLGEDLVVRVKLREPAQGELELRSTQGYDAARGLHHFTVNLVPADGGVAAVNNARAALTRIDSPEVFGCSLDYDRSLRSQLDPAALSRALTSSSSFLDPYFRAALRRLGELAPDGVIELTDGSRFRAALPIELSAAQIQSAQAIGYLALLRRFVEELEPQALRRSTLRGLIAPEVSGEEFDAMLDAAEQAERSCAANPATAGGDSARSTAPSS